MPRACWLLRDPMFITSWPDATSTTRIAISSQRSIGWVLPDVYTCSANAPMSPAFWPGLTFRRAHPVSADRASGERMADTLIHRGPDDSDVWASSDGDVMLAHRRLSIIDLSPLGRNPMSWDGRLWITFNGEIYNFRELRADLEN